MDKLSKKGRCSLDFRIEKVTKGGMIVGTLTTSHLKRIDEQEIKDELNKAGFTLVSMTPRISSATNAFGLVLHEHQTREHTKQRNPLVDVLKKTFIYLSVGVVVMLAAFLNK